MNTMSTDSRNECERTLMIMQPKGVATVLMEKVAQQQATSNKIRLTLALASLQ
jgi:hypothetical protein